MLTLKNLYKITMPKDATYYLGMEDYLNGNYNFTMLIMGSITKI